MRKKYFIFWIQLFVTVLIIASIIPLASIENKQDPLLLLDIWATYLLIFTIIIFPFCVCQIHFISLFNRCFIASKKEDENGIKPLMLAWKPFKGYCFIYDGICSKFYKTEKEVKKAVYER
jgi:hypothetical protein